VGTSTASGLSPNLSFPPWYFVPFTNLSKAYTHFRRLVFTSYFSHSLLKTQRHSPSFFQEHEFSPLLITVFATTAIALPNQTPTRNDGAVIVDRAVNARRPVATGACCIANTSKTDVCTKDDGTTGVCASANTAGCKLMLRRRIRRGIMCVNRVFRWCQVDLHLRNRRFWPCVVSRLLWKRWNDLWCTNLRIVMTSTKSCSFHCHASILSPGKWTMRTRHQPQITIFCEVSFHNFRISDLLLLKFWRKRVSLF